ncbi:MIC subunit MIC26-like protein [Elsinoe fawcettii]|nr:MIC subunit MIC26-like protein [Elsinoe fawcettii]
MAFAPGLRQRAVPLAVLTTGLALYPKRSLFAETLDDVKSSRKPIYDVPLDARATPQDIHDTTIATASPVPPAPARPTPTDRLASQIKETRLFLHKYAVKAEDGVNNTMTRFLRLESDFTSTIASLAPPKGSNERVLPGAVYVLVAAMAGSIITRNRNILLRATVPVAAGITTSYYALPITTRNVGDLIWKYEEKYPVIRDNHLRIKDRVTHFVQTGIAHSKMGVAMAEEKVSDARDKVEDWVRKGK